MKTILFVCTGNIFRSVTAQRALAKEICGMGLKDEFRAESAGTSTANAVMRSDLMNAWRENGLVFDNHTPRQVSKELLDSAAAVISMSLDHQEFIWSHFRRQTYLFNQLACGRNEPVLDLSEVIEDYEHNFEAATKYIEYTVQYIISATPSLFRELGKVLL